MIIRKLMNTLKQPSTYAGLAAVASALGAPVNAANAVLSAVIALLGVAAVVIDETGAGAVDKTSVTGGSDTETGVE